MRSILDRPVKTAKKTRSPTATDTAAAQGPATLQEAAEAARDAAGKAQAAYVALAAAVDTEGAATEDMQELILAGEYLAQVSGVGKAAWQESLMAWFRHNAEGVREVVVGENQYYPTKAKRLKMLSHVRTGQDLFRALAEDRFMAHVHGDIEMAEQLMGLSLEALTEFLERAVSSSKPYKDAATIKILEAAAAAAAQEEVDPGADTAAHKPPPVVRKYYRGQPTAEDLERLGASQAAPHFVELWPDAIDCHTGKPKKVEKLGVANQRFLTGRGGGTPKEVGEAIQRRESLRALAAKAKLKTSKAARSIGAAS